MDRTNWIRYILTATDRASRQVLAADAAIRRSVRDTEHASTGSASRQSSAFSHVAGAAESSSKRVVRSLDGQSRASRAAREELRKFGFEQTRAWRAGAALDNHLRNTNLHLTRLRHSMRNLIVPGIVAVFTMLAQALSTAAGGAISLIGALEPLGGVLATLPGAVLGVAQAFGTLYGALQPAMKAVQDYLTLWRTAATQQQSATKRLDSANKAIRTSHEAVISATEGAAKANRTLKDSQEEAERAQVDLSHAIAEGRRELVDLKNAAIDAALAQKQAGLSLRQALLELHKARNNPTGTMLEIEQAELAVEQAKQGAREATIEANRASTDSLRAHKRGVQQLPGVVAARKALTAANEQEAEAARGVVTAERAVRKALIGVKEAAKNSGLAINYQARQMVSLKYDLAQLSPAGRQFAIFMAKFIQGPISNLQKTAQTAFLPKLTKGIHNAMAAFPVFSRVIRNTGNTLGVLAEEGGKLVGSKGFSHQIALVAGNNTKVMRILGRAAMLVARGMADVAVAARPLTLWLARLVHHWAQVFETTMKAREANGALARKFEETERIIHRLVSISSNLWHAFNNIFHISKTLGNSMFAAFDRSSRKFKEWTESARGKTSIERFFEKIKPALFEAGRLISDLVKGLAQMGMTSGLAEVIHQMRVELLPAILRVSTGFSAAFGPGLINLLTSVLNLFDALGHPLTVMLNAMAKIVDVFSAFVAQVPGAKELLGVLIEISLASRAISFVGAITGLSALIGKIRDLNAARKLTMGASGIRGLASSTVEGVKQSITERGSTPAVPLYVAVVNQIAGAAGEASTAASTVAGEARTAETTAGGAAAGGFFSRVKGKLPRPGRALVGGAAATAAIVGGSLIPGKVPGTSVGIGSAVSNIGTGAALGATLAPETLGLSIAVGAGLGALLTFRKQIVGFFGWAIDFVKKHAQLVSIAFAPLTFGLSLVVYAAVKFRHQIADALGGAFRWMLAAGRDAVDFFLHLPREIWAGLKALPGLLWSALKSTPRMLGLFVGFFVTLPIRIPLFFSRMTGKIAGMLISLAPRLFRWGTHAMGFLARAIWEGIKRIVGFTLSLPGRMLHALTRLPGQLWRVGSKAFHFFLGALKDGAGGILHFVRSLPGKIIHAIGSLASKIYEAGKGFAKEFAKGVYDALPGPIRDAIDWSAGAVGDVGHAIGGVFSGGGGGSGPSHPGRSTREAERLFKGGFSFVPPGLGDGSHKKARKNWKDTADAIGKSADNIAKKVAKSFHGQGQSADSGSEHIRKSVHDKFGRAASAASSAIGAMAHGTAKGFSTMNSTASKGSEAFAKSVGSSMGSATQSVYKGMSYIGEATSSGLKAFHEKPIHLHVKPPHVGGQHRAGGGWVGAPGERGPDDQLVWMGRGEAVLNHSQQNIVEPALRMAYGMGLDDLFAKVQTPHSFASGGFLEKAMGGLARFAKGGIAKTSNVILPARSSPIWPLLTKLSKMGFEITSARDGGHAPNSFHFQDGGEAADYGNSVNNLGRLSRVLWPMARRFAELFMPRSVPHGGLYHYGRNFFDAPLQGEHEDHIHVAVARTLGALKGLGAAGMTHLPRLMVAGQGPQRRIAQGAINKVRAAAQAFLGRRQGLYAGISGGGGNRANMALGRRMMLAAPWHWGMSQWPSLKSLWMGESAWSETARNPTSGAAGIPQALPASKMGAAAQGSGPRAAKAQIAWGLKYIHERYGSPSAAYKAWLARSPHWYARGGFVGRGGRAIRRFAQGGGWKPRLNFSHSPEAGPANSRLFGTSASAFPFKKYGFSPVELFDWEKLTKDSKWKAAEKAMRDALAALGQKAAKHFKKWAAQLETLSLSKLDDILGRLHELIAGEASKLKHLVSEATKAGSAGGKKVTARERKAIEQVKSHIRGERRKARLVRHIRAPLERFHSSIQDLNTGQLRGVQDQIKEQQTSLRAEIAKMQKGGVSPRERKRIKALREQLKRLSGMTEEVANTITEHLQAIMKAAEGAVAAAQFQHNMANAGLEHLELEQQLKGVADTKAAKSERANYINQNIIPALQAEQATLEQQLAAAREMGGEEGEELARQIAEQIADVQNGILKEQLEAQELTAEEVASLNDAITGTLGFDFQSQRFTDLIGLGVGA